MSTLRDMPMITIEQKNRFRDAALQLEAERDQLAGQLTELRQAAQNAIPRLLGGTIRQRLADACAGASHGKRAPSRERMIKMLAAMAGPADHDEESLMSVRTQCIMWGWDTGTDGGQLAMISKHGEQPITQDDIDREAGL